jgi:hypothetical protein
LHQPVPVLQLPLQHCELFWQVRNGWRHIWQVLSLQASLQQPEFAEQNSPSGKHV